jgi:lysophospholipase L1-like esterase
MPANRSAAAISSLLLAAASCGLVVLAVVGAEAVARRVAPDYLVERRGLYVYSDTLGWTARRGATAVLDGRKVTINARGYRGHALALPKPPGLTRVVLLGDSIAFGLGVADGETFADLLQARENGIEVGNMAVQGYGPGQSLLVLLGEGLRARPDAVVMAFCLDNDFADALLSVALYDGRWRKPRFVLQGDRLVLDRSALALTGPQRALQWLSDHSHLFNRLSTLGPRPASLGGAHWTDRKHEALRDEGYALRLSLAIVRRMDALCRERGIPFVLAAFPHWFTYRSKPWLPQRFLESLRAEGIAVLDMSDRFVARGETFRAIALDGGGHLSPLGHAIAAEELESAIAALPRP